MSLSSRLYGDRVARKTRLGVERLEDRSMPAATAVMVAGELTITGGAETNRITVLPNAAGTMVVAKDGGLTIGSFAIGAVSSIAADLGGGNDSAQISKDLLQPSTLMGGAGNDLLTAGGGPSMLDGGIGNDRLYGGDAGNIMLGGSGNDFLRLGNGIDDVDGGAGVDTIELIQPTDIVAFDALDRKRFAPIPPAAVSPILTAAEVTTLLRRASAATASTDAIVAIVDRNGRILGVRTETGVDAALLASPEKKTFAIDGAVAKARTAAFFANNAAPLTSRTVQFISQTTMTQREVESNPNLADPLLRGPGFVAPVGYKGHFPPDIPFTPQVDLFAIEHTNRDSAFANPGDDGLRGTADDIALMGPRFNIDPADLVAGKTLYAPESFGRTSGQFVNGQSRGIATLPGGVPIYRFRKNANGTIDKELVGGIGVFFPGKTGFATEENSKLSTTFDATKPDRTLEAEFIGFAAVGGTTDIPIGTLGGIAPAAGIGIPFDSRRTRIDLVGITLDVLGPGGLNGPKVLKNFAAANPPAATTNGTDELVDGVLLARPGIAVPDGWIVAPHDGVDITAADVMAIVQNGIQQANLTRAAIRLPLDTRTRMVFAVTDRTGEVLGLFRMPDSTVFSIDVAVAKARNVAYYADAAALETVDQLPGVAAGTAFTNRTFRYLALPRFPEGIDGTPPGFFSIINDGGVDAAAKNVGPPLSVFDYDSVQGHDAFFVGTNFRDADDPANQNGIVFFPGSAPLYKTIGGLRVLVGGFGVSGDGVDQDDVVTVAGAVNFQPPDAIRADRVFFRGVRLPYSKFNRNPEA